jgi:hypothetical protein
MEQRGMWVVSELRDLRGHKPGTMPEVLARGTQRSDVPEAI